jgi:hypothetical protein
MKKQQIINYITIALDVYGKDFSDPTIDLYVETILRLPDPDQKTLCRNLINGFFKYFPKPAEIPLLASGSKSIDEAADAKALFVLETVKRVGGYQTVKFDDPVIPAVISRRFGGWARLCAELIEENEKWFLRDFASAYKAMSHTAAGPAPELIGRHEMQNRNANIKSDSQPVQIGRIMNSLLPKRKDHGDG